MKNILIPIVIIIIFLAGALTLYQSSKSINNQNQIDQAADSEVTVETQTIKEDSKEKRLSINVEYPQFKEIKNAEPVNEDIKKTANNLVEEFKKQTADTDFTNLPAEFINAKTSKYEISLQT